MTERPILFSGAMVRAILDGRKTQTRRLINPQPTMIVDGVARIPSARRKVSGYDIPANQDARSPYGQPGDRLWVRETVCLAGSVPFYRADGETFAKVRWSPAIHMPRTASRLTLEVLEVRVQRLQEIGEEDAVAEGVEMVPFGSMRGEFHALWDSINAKRAPWASNPWVWALTFSKVAEADLLP